MLLRPIFIVRLSVMMQTCCEAIRKAGATLVVISFMQSASGQPGDMRTQLRLGGLPQ